MIINGISLLHAEPIEQMEATKKREHGVSFGLSEAGYDIRVAETLLLRPGGFTLASSMEMFDVPAWLVGVVHDKSTHARRGISVFNTVIEPGWKGILTLEIVNHSDEEIEILAGSGIAQILFSELTEHSSYTGKYQNQEAGPQKARFA